MSSDLVPVDQNKEQQIKKKIKKMAKSTIKMERYTGISGTDQQDQEIKMTHSDSSMSVECEADMTGFESEKTSPTEPKDISVFVNDNREAIFAEILKEEYAKDLRRLIHSLKEDRPHFFSMNKEEKADAKNSLRSLAGIPGIDTQSLINRLDVQTATPYEFWQGYILCAKDLGLVSHLDNQEKNSEKFEIIMDRSREIKEEVSNLVNLDQQRQEIFGNFISQLDSIKTEMQTMLKCLPRSTRLESLCPDSSEPSPYTNVDYVAKKYHLSSGKTSSVKSLVKTLQTEVTEENFNVYKQTLLRADKENVFSIMKRGGASTTFARNFQKAFIAETEKTKEKIKSFKTLTEFNEWITERNAKYASA